MKRIIIPIFVCLILIELLLLCVGIYKDGYKKGVEETTSNMNKDMVNFVKECYEEKGNIQFLDGLGGEYHIDCKDIQYNDISVYTNDTRKILRSNNQL